MQGKVRMKIEQLARMRVALMTDTRIAQVLGISYSNLQQIIRRPEYQLYEDAIRRSQLGGMDVQLQVRQEAMNLRMEAAVPEALETLIEQVRAKRDLRQSFEAAKEILDRDPKRRFTKVVRATPANAQAPAPPELPDSVLAGVQREAEKSHEVLMRVPSFSISKEIN